MTELRLYNTLTRRVEPFVPRDSGEATVYTCGPTVYDRSHIGHLRPALLGDVLVSWLRASGYHVRFVANFTDIDDRIIDKAQREQVDFHVVAERYIADYLDVMRRLGVNQVDRYVRATDHIAQIVALIEQLVERGVAYPLEGDVYFDVTRDPDYGRLSGRTLDQMLSGARVKVDDRKRNPMDFALWKGAKPGEPSWPSPWGPGRPGWHIECSAMTLEYFGMGFDIHAGGDDLIFPHHENEIAQAQCALGTAPFARYWLHNAMLQISAEKMSKSLGNTVALHDLVRHYPPAALRLFILSSHYRKPMEFSNQAVEDAERGWRRLANARRAVADALAAAGSDAPAGDGSGASDAFADAAQQTRTRFAAALNDDLNTPLALAALFDLARATNAALAADKGTATARHGMRAALAAFDELGDILGIWVGGQADASASNETAEGLLQLLLELRGEARAARDWATSDRIRDRLAELGVALEDGPAGTTWKWAR